VNGKVKERWGGLFHMERKIKETTEYQIPESKDCEDKKRIEKVVQFLLFY
jgi:hypothetical protein